MEHSGVPKELLFNDHVHGVTSEMLHEWLGKLCERNSMAVQNAEPIQVCIFFV